MHDLPPLPQALIRPPAVTSVRRRSGAVWVTAVLVGTLSVAVGYGVGKALKHSMGSALSMSNFQAPAPVGLVLGAVLALWVVLAVHELGHLIGAQSAGWKPALFCVGPLRIDFGTQGARVSFNRAWGTWGGLAAAVPPPERATPQGMARVVAGGPVASVVLALVGVGMVGLAAPPHGWVALGWGMVAFSSGAIALATLIPSQLGGFRSDGAQLWALWRRDPAVDERLALSTVWAQSMAGVRPRDWALTAIKTAMAAQHDPQVRLLGALMKAQASLDRRDLATAAGDFAAYAQLLHDGGFASLAATLRPALLLPVVVYLGQFRHESEAARAWLAVAAGGMAEPHAQAHGRAALAFAEGHWAQARTDAEQALALGAKSQDPGAWQAARDDLQALLRALPAL